MTDTIEDSLGNSPYDVIIVGAGPAALSCAVFTARAQLKTLLFGFPEKSMLHNAQQVGNYLATDGINGPDWLEKALEQIQHYGAQLLREEVVHATAAKEGGFEIKTADNRRYRCKTLVIATGLAMKHAGIAREQELLGKGVHTCVACDGWPYKNKKVVVIGHASHAAEEAIELLAFTRDITILSNGKEFDISSSLKAELEKNGVQMRPDRVAALEGTQRLEKILLKDGSVLTVDGVFMAIGSSSALSFAQKLALDTKDTFLVVDRDGKTSMEGVYAAGACTGGNTQIAKSVGDGCNAAIAIIRKLKGLNSYSDLT